MARLVLVAITAPGTGPSGEPCIEPTIGSFGQRVYDAMEPIQITEARLCYPFKKYVGALGEIYQDADDIARGNNLPWSIVVDIDNVPDYGLYWLAQFVGVKVPKRYNSVEARAYIKATPNWRRGTRSAIEGAGKLHLTGEQHIYTVERYDDGTVGNDPPYTILVNTLISETPDPDSTFQDLMTQKPAGIILIYRAIAGQTYQHLFETSADYDVVYEKYSTYQRVFDDDPD